ncbi:MAG: c-type cytochrome [Gemmatimonadetes bacterium]|nr:c-type cytochrome [Gemmatimonadota bacterium]
MRQWHIVAGAVVITAALAACSGDPNARTAQAGKAVSVAPGTLTRTELAQFAPLPKQMANAKSPSTAPQVALGRKLYYETTLSSKHDVSCNSCHPLNAYGADGRAKSFGDHGQLGGRNSPSVYNAAGQVAQFWDGRAPTVEEQAKGPILNPAEMGMPNTAEVLAHLRESPEYRVAFKAAFPTDAEPVSYDNVGRAIGAFERGLITPARWDRYLEGDVGSLTLVETRGAKTFVAAGCASCHNGAFVGGGLYQKAGVARAWPTTADSGRLKVTGINSDLFVFKVPSLRNVAMTAPYFHDGSVASLDEAIRMMGQHQLGVELTDAQVKDIRSWMDSLTGELPVEYIALPQLPKR